MPTEPPSEFQRVDFGNEAGDDVMPSDVEDFFIEQEEFAKYLDPAKRILLATAKKGVGKSALIQWIDAKKDAELGGSAIIINCKGSDLVRSNFNLDSTLALPNDFIQDWKKRICAMINRRIGSMIDIAVTDDKITLVESAEIDGFRRRNLVSTLFDRMTKLIPAAEAKKLHAQNEIELLKRVSGGTMKVWFLVDDLDATYQRSERENIELSTFFSACRSLATQVNGVNFRITMRTDVWPLIRRFDEQLDKMDQYVSDITWSQNDFRRLLAKRIRSQLTLLNASQAEKSTTNPDTEDGDIEMISKVFDSQAEWGDRNKPVYEIIYTLSYHRPRWAIQLCKLAQADAVRRKQNRISKQNITSVWGEYGKKRIDDLIVEHKHQCKDVEELINSFRGATRQMSRDELLLWITNHVISHITPVIEGRTITKAIDIANYLYRLGFIVARSESEDEGYEHYFFADMPDFLESRTSKDFGVKWEIHPCYREALDIVKLNASKRAKRYRSF
jgi:hypothetical protein